MTKTSIFLVAALLATPAFAQADKSHASDRVAAYIGALVLRVESQQDQIAALQQELAKAQARIKELEPKKEEAK